MIRNERKEIFYLTTHSTQFIYGDMAHGIGQFGQQERKPAAATTRATFRLAARVLLFASSHRPIGRPTAPRANALTTELRVAPPSGQRSASRPTHFSGVACWTSDTQPASCCRHTARWGTVASDTGSCTRSPCAGDPQSRRSRSGFYRKEGNVLFNDALNTFYLRLYGVRHMVKDHSDSERGNPLPPQGFFYMYHPTDWI